MEDHVVTALEQHQGHRPGGPGEHDLRVVVAEERLGGDLAAQPVANQQSFVDEQQIASIQEQIKAYGGAVDTSATLKLEAAQAYDLAKQLCVNFQSQATPRREDLTPTKRATKLSDDLADDLDKILTAARTPGGNCRRWIAPSAPPLPA